MSRRRDDRDQIDAALRARAEDLARYLRPDAKAHRRTSTRLELGRKGSLKVEIAGPNAGRFTDFERTGEGRDPFGFIMDETGLTFRDTLSWARSWLGWTEDTRPAIRRTPPPANDNAAAANDNAEDRQALARTQWQAARRIEGTVAETYLCRRGLTRWPGPGVVRFHPAWKTREKDPRPGPALVFAVTDAAGDLVGAQAVQLDGEGRKLRKRSLGPVGSGLIRLPGSGTIHLAEGPETGLSVWLATGAPVLVAAGQITAKRIAEAPVGPGGALVIAADMPGEAGDPTDQNAERAHEAALARGWAVKIARPEGCAPKSDWNDALIEGGVERVRQGLEAAAWAVPETWRTATARAPHGTVFAARRRIAEGFDRWAGQALDHLAEIGEATDDDTPASPPTLALRVGTGLGKSRQARRTAVEMVRKLRDRGDLRPVVLAVPRHNLADETAADLREIAADLRVAVWRGRAAEDPANPDGETMCRRSGEAAALSSAKLKVEENLCRRRLPDGTVAKCPFYEGCAYIAQARTEADIWVLPHPLLFQAPPKAVGDPAALVVDEDMTAASVGRPQHVALDEIARTAMIDGDDDASADLHAFKRSLVEVLRTAKGRVEVAAIRAALTVEDLADAERLAWRLKIDRPAINPTSTPAEIAAEVRRIGPVNARAGTLAGVFRAIREAAQADHATVPGLRVIERDTKDGDRILAARVFRGRTLHARWRVPTVIADATLRPESLAPLFGEGVEVIEAEAEAPHVRVRQVIDRTFSAVSVCPDPEKSGAERLRHAARTRARLLRYVEARRAEIGAPRDKVLVIAQKAAIAAMRAEGLPAEIETAHFGALAGLDRWRHVRLVVVIGRTAPSPRDMEDLAEALGRRPVETVAGWYDRAPGALDMRGTGSGPPVGSAGGRGRDGTPGTDRHPDALVEAVRWQACEGELVQALGRGRGVNRDADTPLQIDLLTNVPLPLPVDEAGPFEVFEPTPLELMAARGLLVADRSAKGAANVVAAILPDLFKNAQAVKNAGRGGSLAHGALTHKVLFYGRSHRETAAASVRLAGGRYSVPVRIAATTREDAEALIADLLPGAVLIDFEPPNPRTDWSAIRSEALAEARAGREDAAEAIVAQAIRRALASNDNLPTAAMSATWRWWRNGWWRDVAAGAV